MRDLNYVLDEHNNPVVEPDIHKWGAFFSNHDRRRVAKTAQGEVEVSTVFLGLDHGFAASERPILFETLVFGGEHDGDMNRYATWSEAEEGHKRMCSRVFNTPKHTVILGD
jgi:hypothetical protein